MFIYIANRKATAGSCAFFCSACVKLCQAQPVASQVTASDSQATMANLSLYSPCDEEQEPFFWQGVN